MKRKYLWLIPTILITLIIVRQIVIRQTGDELSYIEKVIKKHNSIKDSWTNVKHPTVPKPASSQSTVIYGDSVRVIPKNSTIVKVQTPLNADIPCQNLDVLNTVDDILHWEIQNNTLHIYTKKDSINDEIERWNYIRSLDEEGWEE